MSEEPVMEQNQTEFKATLIEVLVSHKQSIDTLEAALCSQRTLVQELYDHCHSQNERVNQLTNAVNDLVAALDKMVERLEALSDKVMVFEYGRTSASA